MLCETGSEQNSMVASGSSNTAARRPGWFAIDLPTTLLELRVQEVHDFLLATVSTS